MGTTVDNLWNIVRSELPTNDGIKVLFAVNAEYADGYYWLEDGDELSFFPLVSGGKS